SSRQNCKSSALPPPPGAPPAPVPPLPVVPPAPDEVTTVDEPAVVEPTVVEPTVADALVPDTPVADVVVPAVTVTSPCRARTGPTSPLHATRTPANSAAIPPAISAVGTIRISIDAPTPPFGSLPQK